MATRTISINRAPVLTLWATVVAERLGFDEDETFTLGKAGAGLNAYSRGRRLGLFQPPEEKPKKPRENERGEELRIDLCGRAVPATTTDKGIRAVEKGKPVDPDGVRRFLEGRFGDGLEAVRSARTKLARALKPKELAERAYSIYEPFRPAIPGGKKGWGAQGGLDLGVIQGLARHKKETDASQ